MTSDSKDADNVQNSPPTYAQVVKGAASASDSAAPRPTAETSTPAAAQLSAEIDSYPQPIPRTLPARAFGPTPLPRSTEVTILPYYDPRSEWALREGASRARWRFLKAFMVALLIWVALGCLVGGTVSQASRRERLSRAA